MPSQSSGDAHAGAELDVAVAGRQAEALDRGVERQEAAEDAVSGGDATEQAADHGDDAVDNRQAGRAEQATHDGQAGQAEVGEQSALDTDEGVGSLGHDLHGVAVDGHLGRTTS